MTMHEQLSMAGREIAIRGVLTVTLLSLSSATAPAQQQQPAEGNESELLAVLKSDAALYEKAKACQRLAVIGTQVSVEVLAPLLADPELAHYARYALEPIDDPSVDTALRAALDNLQGELKVGVIDSLGVRGDAQAADKLIDLLGDTDSAVASAAAAALGRIGTPEATRALVEALGGPEAGRTAVADACLTAADAALERGQTDQALELFKAVRGATVPKQIQTAALAGIVRASRPQALAILEEHLQSEDQGYFDIALYAAGALDGTDVTEVLVRKAKELSPARQALVLQVLGTRGDKAALAYVLDAAGQDEVRVRSAAVRALGALGDASAVPLLLKAAAGAGEDDGADNIGQSALDSLTRIADPEVDAKVVDLLKGSQDREQLVLVQLAGLRGIAAAVPTLFELADSSDAQVQRAAIESLGVTVQFENLSPLVARLVDATSPEMRAAVKEALQRACLRMPDRAAAASIVIDSLNHAPATTKGDLLDLLGVLGGQRSLAAVAAAARDANEPIQDAATRVLGQWLSPDAAPVLLELVESGESRFHTRALRGYIRIIRQFDLPEDERLTMCRRALALAERDEERELVLNALTRIPSLDALKLAATYLNNPALQEPASIATVAIAEKMLGESLAGDREVVASTMEKVLATTRDDGLKSRAGVVLESTRREPQ